MRKLENKIKISTIALILILTISATLVALPAVNAQQLEASIDTGPEAILNVPTEVELDDAAAFQEGIKFAYKPPGATDFILTTEYPPDELHPGEPYVAEDDGDVEIMWIPTELGEYQLKWVIPSLGLESNVLTVTVLLEVLQMSYSFIGAVPNPAGVNQAVLLHVGITREERRVDYGWEGLTVTVKRPDGETDTLGPYDTDATGGTGGIFTPTMTGTYELQTHFPKQQGSDGITMMASESDVLELVVQQDPIEYYPGHSLPSEYWTRPIDAQLREWYTIAGQWLENPPNLYAPYNEDAPETSHILWTKPITSGGLVGGETGEHAFDCGDAYEGLFNDPIIMAGRLYYTDGGSRPLTRAPAQAPVVTHCVDLHTGEELWSKVFLDNRSISFGQQFYWDSFNYHGVFDYLWVTLRDTWYAFDAFTGDWRFTVENMPNGERIVGPNGEIQILDIDTSNGEMSLWSMDGWIHTLTGSTAGSWGNTVEGRIHDADSDKWADSWLWSVPIPTDLQGGVQEVFAEDRVIGGETTSQTHVTLWGLSLEPGQEGTLLFDNTWQAPDWEEGDITFRRSGLTASSSEDKVAVMWIKEFRKYYGFSLETGKYLWETEPQHYLQIYVGTNEVIHGGRLYSTGVSGILNCHSVTTGDLLWSYPADDPYQEILWANNWWLEILFIADGKIYAAHGEHSVIDPKPRGGPFVCLDAENGNVIWRVNGLFRSTHWGDLGIIGDSIIATMDTYDQRIYAIGKGPSATTITASPEVSVHGSSVLIKGMVTDISPGTQDPALALRFPNGVPAVSDESMSDWMLYVYKQFERPADATGVQVKLEAYDPNGNYQNLGTTTSDSYGTFGLAFEPEIPGTYWISATFEGSNGYYGSQSTTYLQVDPAPDPLTVDIPPYPGYQGPSASDVAQNVLDRLPDDPTAGEIAQEVLDQMPAYPDYPEAPEAQDYTNIFTVIAVAIAVVAALVVYNIYTVRKQRK